MVSLDLIGVILGLFGFLFFFIQITKSNFKQYAGIQEYKRMREKVTVNKRENASEEIEAFKEADLIDDSDGIDREEDNKSLAENIATGLGHIVGLVICMYVLNRMIEAIQEELINMGSYFVNALGLVQIVSPILLGVTIISTVMNIYVKVENKKRKDLDEYVRTKKKYDCER